MTASRFFTGVAAAWVFAAGLRWGTMAAGGADSYGYVSQAQLVLAGSLVVDQPIAREVPWPDADWTFTPLGYRPGLEPGTIVPVYPVGLPLVMAPLLALGGPPAIYLAVPLLGATAILTVAGLASRMASPAAGLIAALILAARPMFIYSAMWPMSDVPATAWWAVVLMLATGVGLGSAAGAGVAAALAILTRPNLVGLAVAPAAYLALRAHGSPSDRRLAVGRLAIFVLLVTLGSLAVAAIHTRLFGSPLQSGHGSVGGLFSPSYAPANLTAYLLSPIKFEPLLVLLALIGAVATLRLGGGDARGIAWLCLGTIALVFASYALYPPSPDWWYLRFLLPAYPAAAALAGAGAVWLARRAGEWEPEVVQALAAVIVVSGLLEARERRTFGFRTVESRYEAAGRFINRALPENAVFFAFQESGSVRYYTGRMSVRFDLLRPEWLDRAVAALNARGYRPYFLIEELEEPVFRNRFGATSALGNIDWPAAAELKGAFGVKIFDPADRARQQEGKPIVTQEIEP
jgi:hypothetical protein